MFVFLGGGGVKKVKFQANFKMGYLEITTLPTPTHPYPLTHVGESFQD